MKGSFDPWGHDPQAENRGTGAGMSEAWSLLPAGEGSHTEETEVPSPQLLQAMDAGMGCHGPSSPGEWPDNCRRPGDRVAEPPTCATQSR